MSAHSAIGYRPTWAEISLDNLSFNLRQIKSKLIRRTKVLATVKADAYGHGLVPVARRLVSEGVDYLGVATIGEGIRLREEGVTTPVLVLGMVLADDIEPLFKYGLSCTVCTPELVRVLDRKGRSLGKKVKAHVKIDTGMGRLGVMQKDAMALIRAMHRCKGLEVEGLFTHFAFADLDDEYTMKQMSQFCWLVSALKTSGISIPLIHAANSMGLINLKSSHFNMVRPGIVLYGLNPANDLSIRLKPVLSLKTRVVYTKRVPAGYGISYGHAYVTAKESTIATLPLGYGDGYPRNLSNLASVLIKGAKFRISGRICMDQILVDVGDSQVKAGDEAVLIGAQGRQSVTAEELAAQAGTIPYEIVCGLGSRIPRLYI